MSEAYQRAEIVVRAIWALMVKLAIIVGLCYLCYRTTYILIMLVAAGVMACAINPLVELLLKRMYLNRKSRINRFLVSLLAFLAIAAMLLAFVTAIAGPARVEVQNLQEKMPTIQRSIDETTQSIREWYQGLAPEVRRTMDAQIRQFESLGTMVGVALARRLEYLRYIVEVILTPVLAFYFVYDYREIKRELLFFIPRRYRRSALHLFASTGTVMQAYVLAQVLLAMIAGTVVAGGLLVMDQVFGMGIRYWVVLSLIAGVTRIIPIVGPLIGAIPIIILCLPQGLPVAATVAIFLSCLHFVESKLIMPMILGSRMDLHPVTIIVVLLMGGAFFGLIGMFIAPPVAGIIKQMLGRREKMQLRSVAGARVVGKGMQIS